MKFLASACLLIFSFPIQNEQSQLLYSNSMTLYWNNKEIVDFYFDDLEEPLNIQRSRISETDSFTFEHFICGGNEETFARLGLKRSADSTKIVAKEYYHGDYINCKLSGKSILDFVKDGDTTEYLLFYQVRDVAKGSKFSDPQ